MILELESLRDIAQAALDAFGVRPEHLRLLRYEDNAVYLVEQAAKRYSLRLSIRDGRTAAEQQSELAWLDSIKSHGQITVPVAVPTLTGARVATISSPLLPEGSDAVLFDWIHGRIDPPPTRALATRVGRVIALLHEEGRAFEASEDFARPSWGFDDLFDGGAAMNDQRAIKIVGQTGVDVVRSVNDRLREGPFHDGDWSLIHADLHAENIVATSDGGIAVIDFDDCGFGYPMLDVATMLSSMYRRADPRAYPALAGHFLDGYADVRPLPSAIERLDAFLILRDMVILNFVVSSHNATVYEWGGRRARGIVGELRRWLTGESYVGALPAEAYARFRG